MATDLQRAISIPEPTDNPISLWSSVKALKETVEVMQGIRGNREYALDSALNNAINQLQIDIDNISIPGGGVGGGGISEINIQNGNYALVITDVGKTIYKTSGGSGETITIPADFVVAFNIGTMIGVQNDGGGSLTIAIQTDTLTSSVDNTTGSKVLADGGAAVIIKVTATSWKISGDQMT